MKAVGLIEYGGPEVLHIIELKEPQLGPGQVRIRVHAAAVSPVDTVIRSGRGRPPRTPDAPPSVLGMDAAGVLEEIASDVETDLHVGDHVMAIVTPNGSHGAYCESIVVPAESVTRVPKGVTDVEASTLPMNGLTACLALDVLALHPGQCIAVTGAAGAFGGYVVQLAKASTLTVVADASESDEELAYELGADIVVRRGDDFARQVQEHFPDGVDGAADGALLNASLVPAVRDGGVIVSVRGYNEPAERGVTFRPIWVHEHARARNRLDDLRQLVENGDVSLRVAGTVPKERASEAHRRLEAGGVRGRFVIEF